MTEQDRTFQDAIKINKVRTRTRVRLKPPTWDYNSNYEEFRTVYGNVLSSKARRTSSINNVRLISSPIFGASKYKPNLKLVKLEMPVLGAEKAIIGPPKRKILRTKSILKKSTSEPKGILKRDFVTTLKQIEVATPVEKKPSIEVKKHPSKFLEDANNEVSVAEKQLEKIKSMLMKRHGHVEKIKIKRPTTPIYRKAIPKRHSACFKKNYFSTLSTVQQKLKDLEQKYFSKPQIVFKSVNDNFTQSSDVKILFENTNYPEDTKLDQALKGIISELDDLVNVKVDEPSLAPIDKEQKKSIAALIKQSEVKEQESKALKEEIMTYLYKNKSEPKIIEEEEEITCNPFTSNSLSMRNNIRNIINTNTNVMGFKLDDGDDEIDYESKRSFVPRNLNFMHTSPKPFTPTIKTESRNSIKTKKSTSKVRFEEPPMIIPISDDSNKKTQDVLKIKNKFEDYLQQLRTSTEKATKYMELNDIIKNPKPDNEISTLDSKAAKASKTFNFPEQTDVIYENPKASPEFSASDSKVVTASKTFNFPEECSDNQGVTENIGDGLDIDYSGVDEILAKYGFKRDTTGNSHIIHIGDSRMKEELEDTNSNQSVTAILQKYGYKERDFDANKNIRKNVKIYNVAQKINRYQDQSRSIGRNFKITHEGDTDKNEKIEMTDVQSPQTTLTKTNSTDSVFTIIDDTRTHLQELITLQKEYNFKSGDVPNNNINDVRVDILRNEAKSSCYYNDDYKRKPRNAYSFKTNIHSSDEENDFQDIIAKTIDKSEARLKQLRNIKHDLNDVNKIYDGIIHVKDEDRKLEAAKLNENKTTVKQGTGDESGVFEGTNLQKSVMESCYLMKEFNLQPSVKFFCHNESIVPTKKELEETTEKCIQSSYMNVQKLKETLDVALQNSLFSFSGDK